MKWNKLHPDSAGLGRQFPIGVRVINESGKVLADFGSDLEAPGTW